MNLKNDKSGGGEMNLSITLLCSLPCVACHSICLEVHLDEQVKVAF